MGRRSTTGQPLSSELKRVAGELTAARRHLARQLAVLELPNAPTGTAPDLRNALGAIKTNCELLLTGALAALSADEIELLTIIQTSSERMLRRINDVLAQIGARRSTRMVDRVRVRTAGRLPRRRSGATVSRG